MSVFRSIGGNYIVSLVREPCLTLSLGADSHACNVPNNSTSLTLRGRVASHSIGAIIVEQTCRGAGDPLTHAIRDLGAYKYDKYSFSPLTGTAMMPFADRFAALQALPVSVAVLDSSGKILAVNEAWRAFGARNGLKLPEHGVGQDYLRYGSDKFKRSLKNLLVGKLDLLTLIYPCHSPEIQRWFFLVGMPLAPRKPSGAALVHTNISELIPLPRTELGTISQGVEGAIGGAVTKQIVDLLEPSRDEGTLTTLTNRQKDILRLISKGKSNKEIADLIGRSQETVKVHVAAILRRLDVKNRTEAALLASRLPFND